MHSFIKSSVHITNAIYNTDFTTNEPDSRSAASVVEGDLKCCKLSSRLVWTVICLIEFADIL